MMQFRSALFLVLFFGLFNACVPAKKLEDASALNNRLMEENSNLRKQLEEESSQLKMLTEKVNEANDQVRKLVSDTAYMGEKYRKSESLNKDINELYEQAIQQNQLLVSKSSAEKLALNDSLKRKQQDLYKKGKQLDSLQQNLTEREKKLAELQALVHQKDSAASALKAQLTKALLGFEKSDLTVEQRNGKVYVSMADKLLFKSGSTVVDPKGVEALKKLSAVLKQNKDLTIEVEGHTDNVPLAGTGTLKDNWDLSVMRATSITRILTDNGVDPKQITAAGKGEYYPVASNDAADGRSKNRRTEIILSPRLDELMKILGN
ncbi:MAG: OmpA family protein [Chitinophagales bacterium]|nr:OmpA family protein [Chitinophagales bacterium]